MNHLEPQIALYNVPFRTYEYRGMPFRPLGGCGLQVPNIGLGTWKFGYPQTGDGSRVDEQSAYAIFARSIELGATLWDTANRYNAASGNSERLIGKWLKQHPGERRNVIIATKVFGGMDGLTPNHSGLSRNNIVDSVHACLQRLQLDYIDVLYFHGFDSVVPIEESLSTIEDLVRQGLIRYFAVSNFSVEQLEAYRAIQERLSIRSRIAAVQNQYDILHGESPERSGVLEYCARHQIAFVAWSPLAGGLLTQRYLDPSQASAGDRLVDEGLLERMTAPSTMAKLHQLASLASAWDMGLSQLAMAYMLTLPGMGPIIPSSSTVRQIESNAAAGRITLTNEQLKQVQGVVSQESVR